MKRNRIRREYAMEQLEDRTLLSVTLPTIIDPTVLQKTKSITLTSGAQTYLYGETDGGGRIATPLANGTVKTLNDADTNNSPDGNLADAMAETSLASNSFTTTDLDFGIAGVGVSGYEKMQATYGQVVFQGSEEITSSSSFPCSVNFSVPRSGLVVVIALASASKIMNFQSPPGFSVDYASDKTSVAIGIEHGDFAAGNYTVTAASSVVKPTRQYDISVLVGVFVFLPDIPAQLVFAQPPSDVTAGAKIRPSVVLDIEDSQGNILTSDDSAVTLVAQGGAGVLGGNVTVNAFNGVATFSDVFLDTAGTYTLSASDGDDGLAGFASDSFNVSAADAAKLTFFVQPAGAHAGLPMSPNITVKVKDRFGNRVTTDDSVITLTIASGPTESFDPGSTQAVEADNGIATFYDVAIDIAGTYTLSASDGSLTPATSVPFAISHAGVSQLIFVQQPSDVTAGVAVNPGIKVKIADIFGNRCTNKSSVITLEVESGPDNGKILGSSISSVAATAGRANFTDIALNKAGLYTLAATDGDLGTAFSDSFSVNHAAAAKLVFIAQPSNATAGSAITPPMVVDVTDAFGNICGGNGSSITLSIAGHPNGKITGTLTVAAIGGQAVFYDVILEDAGTYTLAAADGSLAVADSMQFTVS